MTAIIDAASTQDQQFKWLMVTGSVALVLGLVAAPFLARLLPLVTETRVAAAVMATDRWNAGETLTETQHPESRKEFVAAGELFSAKQDPINTCRAAAVKSSEPMQGDSSIRLLFMEQECFF